jgi:hypothetical protein
MSKEKYSLSSLSNGLTITGEGIMTADLNLFGSNSFKKVGKVMPDIEQVIFQNDLTIVVWSDKSRTLVKCSEENFDKEKGLAMAISKKFMDRNKFKKLLEKAVIQNK